MEDLLLKNYKRSEGQCVEWWERRYSKAWIEERTLNNRTRRRALGIVRWNRTIGKTETGRHHFWARLSPLLSSNCSDMLFLPASTREVDYSLFRCRPVCDFQSYLKGLSAVNIVPIPQSLQVLHIGMHTGAINRVGSYGRSLCLECAVCVLHASWGLQEIRLAIYG